MSLNDRQTKHGGLNVGRIMCNNFTENGCGLYVVARSEDMSSNDLLVANNSFTDIDPENFYHNSDTHAVVDVTGFLSSGLRDGRLWRSSYNERPVRAMNG